MKKVEKEVKYENVVAGVDVPVMVENIINGVASGKQAVYQMARQFVENGDDAQASKISLFFFPAERKIIIVDNGTGMPFEKRQRFHTLHIKPSQAKIANKETGRNDSGRLSGLAIASYFEVITTSEELPPGQAIKFFFSRKTVEEIIVKGIKGDKTPFPKEIIEKGKWNKYLPGTGTIVILHDVDWDDIPGLDTIRKNLPYKFISRISEKVYVNDKPIGRRPILGDPIQYVETHPVLGTIDIDMSVTADTKEVSLQLAGKDPIFDQFKTFVHDYVPEDLRMMIPEAFFYKNVAGVMAFSGLNDFRDHQSENRLEKRVTKSLFMKELITYLHEKLGPMLVKALKLRESKKSQEELDDFADHLMAAFNPLFGFDPRKDVGGLFSGKKTVPVVDPTDPDKGDDLVLNRAHVTLLAGETQTFRIKNLGETSGTFHWDHSNSGGLLSFPHKKRTEEVEYTAGAEPGDYVLTVQDKKIRDKKGKVRITVVASKDLSISPRSVHIPKGDTQKFRAVNYQYHSGEVTWSLSGPDTKRVLLSTTKGAQIDIKVQHTAQEGEYTLTASVENGQTASVNFKVIEPPKEFKRFIKVENTVYELTPGNKNFPDMAQAMDNYSLKGGESYPQMQLNLEHELLKDLSRKEKLYAVAPAIAYAHIDFLVSLRKIDDNSPSGVLSRLEQLRLTLIRALQKNFA